MPSVRRLFGLRWLAAVLLVLGPAVAQSEPTQSRFQDLSDEIGRSQTQIEMLRSQGRHGESVVVAQRIDRLVDDAAKGLEGGHDDSAEIAWLVLQHWQERAVACSPLEGPGAVLPAAGVTEVVQACDHLDKAVELAVRARNWAVHRRDAEQTPPNYEQLSEFALQQQGRILAARAMLPEAHAQAVSRAQVPPPFQQWPWSDLDRADAGAKIRVVRAGKPRGELLPGAERWLALALGLQQPNGPTGLPWELAQFLLRAGQIRPDAAAGDDDRDAVWQLGRVQLDTAKVAQGWLAAQQPKKRSSDPKDWAAEERAAYCDQPGRPCAALRLASLPVGAELEVELGANGCAENRKLVLRFKAGKQLMVSADGCPAAPLSAEQAERVDRALGWYAFGNPLGKSEDTSARVRSFRGARPLAEEQFAPRPSAGVEADLYQVAVDSCDEHRAGSKPPAGRPPSGARYRTCQLERQRQN